MSLAPANLLAVAKYWTAHKGTYLGIVGDDAHTARGTSYHLGKDHLIAGAYSARTPRDLAGLSNYASAIDLGMLDGTFSELRAFSSWLVEECRHNAPDTRDIREVIFSPDGHLVWRWDRENGVASPAHDGEADNSHLTHTHISWYRDSRGRSQVGPFQRYLEPPAVTHTLHVKKGARVRRYRLSATGCILKVDGKYGTDVTWARDDSKAPCRAPIYRRTCDGLSHSTTVYVPDGPLKGHVGLGPGVTVS